MLGLKTIDKYWIRKAKEAYLSKNERKFFDLDTQMKSSFMLAVLKVDRNLLKDIHSQSIQFFLWVESPKHEKWEKGWSLVHGWQALAEISNVLYQAESEVQGAIEINKRKHFREIVLAVAQDEYIRQKDLAERVYLKVNNLKPKIDDLIKMGTLEKREVGGGVFLRLTPRGRILATRLDKQITADFEPKLTVDLDLTESLLAEIVDLLKEDNEDYALRRESLINRHQINDRKRRKQLTQLIDAFYKKVTNYVSVKTGDIEQPMSLMDGDIWRKNLPHRPERQLSHAAGA